MSSQSLWTLRRALKAKNQNGISKTKSFEICQAGAFSSKKEAPYVAHDDHLRATTGSQSKIIAIESFLEKKNNF